jgi:TusA-related sulfurtransferase
MSDLVIDARELAPPEPMLRVRDALPTLARGATLTLLLPREPFPLYEVLRREGFVWQTRLEPDGTYVITMRHAP